MTVKLSASDEATLAGESGPGARLALSIVVRMAKVYGAAELMDVSQAHVDCCALLTESSLEFAERLVGLGARVAVPTTLNMLPLDLEQWDRFGVPAEFAEQALRIARAYTAMGCIPTWTCAPYQGFLAPRFRQQIAWGESNAIVYANSVLGARTNRYGDFMDLCAAITGRVPKSGLHLDENRRGEILLRLPPLDPRLLASGDFYPVLGHLVGRLAGDRVPVIEGLSRNATHDQLKALGAAAASAGAVGLFHAVGVTPEALTLEAAFGGRTPRQVIDIRLPDLVVAWEDLSTARQGGALDAVIFGCPHFSYTEFEHLAWHIARFGGQRRHGDVRVFALTNTSTLALLQRSTFVADLAAFGVEMVLDTCMFHSPIVPKTARRIMTNSGKCAYYAPGELGVEVSFGGWGDCLASAISGRVEREGSAWREC